MYISESRPGDPSAFRTEADMSTVWLVPTWFKTCAQLCDLSSQNQVTQDLTQDFLAIKSLGHFHPSRLSLGFLNEEMPKQNVGRNACDMHHVSCSFQVYAFETKIYYD